MSFTSYLQSENAALVSCFVKILKGGNRKEKCLVSALNVVKCINADIVWFSKPQNFYVSWRCNITTNTDNTAHDKYKVSFLGFFLPNDLNEERNDL